MAEMLDPPLEFVGPFLFTGDFIPFTDGGIGDHELAVRRPHLNPTTSTAV
jgi:hypothetical protein